MIWYLRKSDQTVYGPVDEATLCGWAADGRILPEDELSADQKIWQPAPSLAALKMEWFLELGEEERVGPLHVASLIELIRDESVLPSQPVTNAVSGYACSLSEAILPALLQPAPAQPAAPAPAAPPAPVEDPELPRLRVALSEAEAKIRALESRPPPAENPELPRLRAALGKAEAKIRELESRPAPPVSIQFGDQTVDADTMLKSYRDLSRSYDQLFAQLTQKNDELAHVLATHSTAAGDLEVQLKQAQEALQTARNELEAERLKFLEAEQNHLMIVKSYRDLNDRYIRLRQEYADKPKPAQSAPSAAKPAVRLV